MSVSVGGGSINSKVIRLLIPKDFSMSTVMPMFVRWISGTVFSSNSFEKAHFVYSRNALPAPTRPARPALWLADAREHWQEVHVSDEWSESRLGKVYSPERQQGMTCPYAGCRNFA